MKSYSQDEKIDFIFKELRAQKRARYFKFFFHLSVICFMIFFYMNYINGMNKEDFTKASWKILWDIIKPIAEDLAKNIISDLENNTTKQ